MKRALLALALAPCLALMLAACGDSADDGPDPTSTRAVEASATRPPAITSTEAPVVATNPSGGQALPTAAAGSAATATPGSAARPPIVSPPAATANTPGGSARLGTGSSCWGTGPASVCIDKQGIITNVQPLPVTRNTTVSIQTGIPQAQIREVRVTAGTPAGQPAPVSATEQSWEPPAQTTSLQGIVNAAGIQFRATLDPGRYVVSIFLRADQGDVTYGLLLQVS